jgi:hypothetical protein
MASRSRGPISSILRARQCANLRFRRSQAGGKLETRNATAGPGVRNALSSGCSSMAEHQLPKLIVRVRFPSSAPMHRP